MTAVVRVPTRRDGIQYRQDHSLPPSFCCDPSLESTQAKRLPLDCLYVALFSCIEPPFSGPIGNFEDFAT